MKLNIHSKWGAPVALLVSTAVLSACGGGSSGGAPTSQNAAPVISSVAAQTINQDTPTSPLAFTVSDDGALVSVGVTVSSSDTTLLPRNGLSLGGAGANRTITVTPAEDATGTANVTVTASDALGMSSSIVFPVTVKAVPQSVASYTNSTFSLMENDTPVQVSGFTFVQDADDEATFTPLLQ